jgi:hypothetical protein
MAALDFPSSPTDGQVYQSWIYSSAKGAWKSKPLTPAKTVNSDTPPSNPTNGDQWFNTVDSTLYIYYTDADTSQWVESRAPIISDGYYSPNVVINGAFDIWQRGTTFTTPNGAYTADRWITYANGTSGTCQRSTDVPSTNFTYSIYAASSSAVYNIIEQRIESTNAKIAGNTVTISFYAKGTAGTNQLQIALYYATAVDNHTTQTFISQTAVGASTLATSWQRYSITTTLPDAAVNNGWELRIFRDNTSANGFVVTGVQVEAGTVATPFRRNANSIQGELAACQRYYYRINSYGNGYQIALGSSVNTSMVDFVFPKDMRGGGVSAIDYANLGIYRLAGQTLNSINTPTINFATPTQTWIRFTGSPGQFTATPENVYIVSSAAGGYLGFSAEL